MDQEPRSHHPNEWEIDNLPNRLTMFRVVLIPIILLSLFFNIAPSSPWFIEHSKMLNYLAAWTFVAASITDFFDGYIARKKKYCYSFWIFFRSDCR